MTAGILFALVSFVAMLTFRLWDINQRVTELHEQLRAVIDNTTFTKTEILQLQAELSNLKRHLNRRETP